MDCIKILAIGNKNTLVELIKEDDKYYVNKKIPQDMVTMLDGTTIINGEYLIMNLQLHPNLIKIYKIYYDIFQQVYHIQMEYFENYRELFDTLKEGYKYNIAEIDKICLQMAYVLDYLHRENNLIHSDVKPENILIDLKTTHIKLIDYGYVQEKNKKTKLILGTIGYMAPELLSRKTLSYDEKIDIWSFGITLYTIAYKQSIINHDKTSNDEILIQYETICKTILNVKNDKIWSEKSLDVFKHCLIMNPDERWSAKEIYDYMQSNYNL